MEFRGKLVQGDFVVDAVEMLSSGLFDCATASQFDCTILNPPYRKIQRASETWGLLRRVGVETTNLYTAFVSLAIKLLEPGGESVAITPRSFCNGSYLRPFRELFLRRDGTAPYPCIRVTNGRIRRRWSAPRERHRPCLA